MLEKLCHEFPVVEAGYDVGYRLRRVELWLDNAEGVFMRVKIAELQALILIVRVEIAA